MKHNNITSLTVLAFSVLAFATLAVAAPIPSAVTSGNTLYFAFNNIATLNETTTTVTDLSWHDNQGSVDGAQWVGTGKFGSNDGSYVFDGINDKITVKDADALSPATTGKFTMSVWVNFNQTRFGGEGSAKDYISILGKGDIGDYEYVLRQYNGSNAAKKNNRITFTMYNKDGTASAGVYVQEPIIVGQWMYLTVSYDGSQLKMWKNGVLKDSKPATLRMNNGGAPLNIGTQNGNSYFKGSIDEVRVYNRALSNTDVQTIYKLTAPAYELPGTTTGTQPTGVGLPGNVLQFNLNKDAGAGETSTHVFDFSRKGNNGTVSGATWTTSGLGGAYTFDGVNDKITIKDADSLSPSTTKQMTIAMWVRFDRTAFGGEGSHRDYLHFMGKGGYGNDYEYMFRQYNASNDEGRGDRISFYLFNLDGGWGTGSYFQDKITPGEWMHVVGVATGTHVQIYKNGVLRDVDPYTNYNTNPSNGNAPLNIGTADGDSYFKGAIDDVRIYSRVLSATEIAAIYNEGAQNIR